MVGLEILTENPEATNLIRVCILANQPVAEVYKCLNQLFNS